MSGNEGTEAPTEHKLKEARKKGDTPQSSALTQAVATSIWSLVLMGSGSAGVAFLFRFVEVLLSLASADQTRMVMGWVGIHVVFGIIPVCVIGLLAALLPELMQSRGRWATKRNWFDIQRINPVQRFKSLFSLTQMLQIPLAFVRFVVVAGVAWHFFTAILPLIQRVGVGPWYGGYQVAWWAVLRVVLTASVACLCLGLIDAFMQNKLWKKRNKMKKDEIKREHKEQEGDPMVKGQRRQAHQESVSG